MPLTDLDSDWDDNEFPIAYLITIRTFGTWLHGDRRSSIERSRKMKVAPTKQMGVNVPLEDVMREKMTQPQFIMNIEQRRAATLAIEEFCKAKDHRLYALNVQANHTHCVVGADAKPERIADALKASVTKRLREEGLVSSDRKIWSRGRSRRYLWKGGHVTAAIDYVLYCQEDVPFELDGAYRM